MATLADLDAALATLASAQAQVTADLTTLIATVNALIAAIQGSGNTDFQKEVDAVNAAVTSIQADDAAEVAANASGQGALPPQGQAKKS